MLTSASALLGDPLWSIPVVMPVPVVLGPEAARLLPPAPEEADYTVHALDTAPLALPAGSIAQVRADANVALDDMEAAARLSEYHDFDWWRERIARVRAGLQP